MPDETTDSTTTTDVNQTQDATTAVDANQAQDAMPSHGFKGGSSSLGEHGPRVKPTTVTSDGASAGHRRPGVRRPLVSGGTVGASSGPEETKVKTEELRATAEQGKQKIKTIKEKLAHVVEIVRSTEANELWMGSAAEEYRELLLHVVETFNKQLDLFAAYPRDLIAYADEQDQVITETNRLAQSVLEEIEAANWPENL